MGLIRGPAQWVKGSPIAALVAAVAQIQSLAWEHPHAASVAIKKKIVREFPSWRNG